MTAFSGSDQTSSLVGLPGIRIGLIRVDSGGTIWSVLKMWMVVEYRVFWIRVEMYEEKGPAHDKADARGPRHARGSSPISYDRQPSYVTSEQNNPPTPSKASSMGIKARAEPR